ncbi:MAG: hypothetical protein WAM30_03710 [Candidatus Dormiibacterota bacterium]
MSPTSNTRRRAPAAENGATSGRRHAPTPSSGDALVADLVHSVDRLLAENRALKREVVQLQRKLASAAGLGDSARTLANLQRRIAHALEASAPPRPQHRRVTDPELLAKRRAALVKARAARAERRSEQRATPG